LLNFQPYKTLFADKALRRIVFTSILPRLPTGINGLAITLMAQQLYSSFGIGCTPTRISPYSDVLRVFRWRILSTRFDDGACHVAKI
jgi:hypothetical protein